MKVAHALVLVLSPPFLTRWTERPLRLPADVSFPEVTLASGANVTNTTAGHDRTILSRTSTMRLMKNTVLGEAGVARGRGGGTSVSES